MAVELRQILRQLEADPRYQVGANSLTHHIQALLAANQLPQSLTELDGPAKPGEFSMNSAELLRQKGAKIYSLTGASLFDLHNSGRRFKGTIERNMGKPVTKEPSRKIQVAIIPEKFVLPRSDSKSLQDHARMVAEFERQLGIPNVKAVIPRAAEVAEIAWAHREATGKRILSRDYNFGEYRIRTSTNIQDNYYLAVGYFGENSLAIDDCSDKPVYDLCVAAILIPG